MPSPYSKFVTFFSGILLDFRRCDEIKVIDVRILITQSITKIKRYGAKKLLYLYSPQILPWWCHQLSKLSVYFHTECELHLSLAQGLHDAVESWTWHCIIWNQRVFRNHQTWQLEVGSLNQIPWRFFSGHGHVLCILSREIAWFIYA